MRRRRRAGVDTATETPLGPSASTASKTPVPSDWLSLQLERASACGSVCRAAAFAAALGAATSWAGLGGGLLYDDRALVIKNQDLRPSTPWTALLFHDFWGTSLDDPRSHTSWRPVTVATLKLNFHTHELEPGGYHAVNLALHAFVCALVVLVAKRCGIGGQQWQSAALCGVLFAVHPVHGALLAHFMSGREQRHVYPGCCHVLSSTSTLCCNGGTVEAVANVAGRAELLSAAFSLLSFLCFTAACPRAGRRTGFKKGFPAIAAACLFFTLSTLAKETGFTVLGAVWAYDLLKNGDLLGRVHTACRCFGSGGNVAQPDLKFETDSSTNDSVRNGSSVEDASQRISPACRDGTAFWRVVLTRHIPLLLSATIYLASRRSLSHRFSPAISARDNHLALEPEWLTRTLSYVSLHGRYAALLLYPTVRIPGRKRAPNNQV